MLSCRFCETMEPARRQLSLSYRWQQLHKSVGTNRHTSSNMSATDCSSSSTNNGSSGRTNTNSSARIGSRNTPSSRRNIQKDNSHRSSSASSRRSSKPGSSTRNSRRGLLTSFSAFVLLPLVASTFSASLSAVVAVCLRTAGTGIFYPPAASNLVSSLTSSSHVPTARNIHVNVFDAEGEAAATATNRATSDSSAFPAAHSPAPAAAAAAPAAAPAAAAAAFGASSAAAAARSAPRAAAWPSTTTAAASYDGAFPVTASAASSAPLRSAVFLQSAAPPSSCCVAFCAPGLSTHPSAGALRRRCGRTRTELFAAPVTSATDRPHISEGSAGERGHSFLKPRILCTGLGVVNGVGVGIEDFWKNLVKGRNVINPVTRFDTTGMACQIACEVPDSVFDPTDYFSDPKDVKRNDRYTHFAMAAARMAMEDAGLGTNGTRPRPDRFGVVIGSGIGGLQWMEQELRVLLHKGPRRVSPLLIPAMIANTASAIVAIEMKAEGPNHGAVSACATAGHSTGTALRYLQSGEADVILCGGAEASITPLSFAGFNAMRAMAQGFNDMPQKASRPFDKKRTGFVMGEGAGVMVLETEEHAIRRGATKIYGEVAGYGATCDAFHVTAPAPDGSGLARCLEIAIKESGVDKADVGYINAHGTSTPMNDRIETRAIKRVFGEEGAKKLLISSTKSMTGHCLGATGGIEACVAAKVLETGIVPPTINYEEPDPDCDLNYVPNEAYNSPTPFEAVLSDTLGFGGHNAALLLRRYRSQRL